MPSYAVVMSYCSGSSHCVGSSVPSLFRQRHLRFLERGRTEKSAAYVAIVRRYPSLLGRAETVQKNVESIQGRGHGFHQLCAPCRGSVAPKAAIRHPRSRKGAGLDTICRDEDHGAYLDSPRRSVSTPLADHPTESTAPVETSTYSLSSQDQHRR